MVSVLAFYSNDQSLNDAKVQSIFCKLFEKNDC